MSLHYVGPIAMDHRNPQMQWTSSPDALGIRSVSITGQTDVAGAQQLSELVDNPGPRPTVGDHSGVLVYVYADGIVTPFRGWYLLESVSVSAERPWSVTPYMPFSIHAAYLGDNRQAVIALTARTRTNVYGVSATALVANPFWDENPSGDPFLVNPGGVRFVREYDETGADVGTTEAVIP